MATHQVLLVGPEATIPCEDGLVVGRGNPPDLKLCTGDKSYSRKCLQFESVGSGTEPEFAVSSLLGKPVHIHRGDERLPLKKGGEAEPVQNGDEIVLGLHPESQQPDGIYVLGVQVRAATDGEDAGPQKPAPPVEPAEQEAATGRPTAKKEEPAPLPPMPERQVWQAKRGRKKVELEVGGMGLSVSAGGKHLDNYLYMSLGGWGEAEGLLQLDLAEGKVVKFTAPEAEEIAEAMTAAARVLAKQAKKKPPPKAPTTKIKLASAEAKPPEPAPAQDDDGRDDDAADRAVLTSLATGCRQVGDKLKCVKSTTIRQSSEMDSAKLENLAKGSVIEVLECVKLETGTVRDPHSMDYNPTRWP